MSAEWAKALVASLVLALLVIAGLGVGEWRTESPPVETFEGLATAIFDTYVLPFEVLSVLLLGALFSALYVGAKNRREEGGLQ
jgi:NADH:ubiquinone oxidoreductase subunit 6 (subunit J)